MSNIINDEEQVITKIKLASGETYDLQDKISGYIKATDDTLAASIPLVADNLKGISSAEVGQVVKVKTVNESGYPLTWEVGVAGVTDAVKYTEQTLTDEQQAQARENISALSAKDDEISSSLPIVATNLEGITGASIGQAAIIKTVDASGNPLTWEAGNSSSDSVKYTEQELTTAQQAQARENIAAITTTDVEEMSSAVPVVADTLTGISTAIVGQIAKVKTIDENGMPTEWEASSITNLNSQSTESISYTTTPPTYSNQNGLKICILAAEPAIKYEGWLYIITDIKAIFIGNLKLF